MKCPHCGGEMSLEDKLCPYCGMPNEEAAEHAREMHRYKEAYRRTEKEVREKTHRQAARFTKYLVSFVLILLSIAAIWFGRNAYSFRYDAQRRAARKNAAAYTAEMETYLAAGDYVGFYESAERRHISFYEDEYAPFVRVGAAARDYCYLVAAFSKLIQPEGHLGAEYLAGYLAESLDDFVDCLNEERYAYYDDTEEWDGTEEAVAAMKSDVSALLKRYLGFTDEEAADVYTMSSANRRLLIERGSTAYEKEE